MTTAFLTHSDCLQHHNPQGHPESVARLEAILKRLDTSEFDGLLRLDAPLGTDADVLLAHPAAHLAAMKAAVPDSGFSFIDGDTSMSAGTLQAALRGVGANVKAVDLVMSGAVKNAFCATRPPVIMRKNRLRWGFVTLEMW